MRYFLPMVRPSNGNEDGSYYYDVNLDLAKMPAGLTTGEYAFAVVHNMRTMRSVEQYSQKTDILPNLSWSTLVAHVQAYGAANGWDEDGPEKTVEAMLHNGARTNEHWVSDLVEWPFSGDRCLLAWCDAVVSQSMLRKRKSETEHGNHPETNGNSCTHLGRWLSQRPHLLPMLPDVVVRLVEYVETVDSMPDYAFDAFVSKYHSSDVQHCEGLHERRLDDGPQFKRKLATLLPKPALHDWVEHAFRSFCLGMAWEMRAHGNDAIFSRMTRTLNRTHTWTNGAQLALCMADASWVEETMRTAMDAAGTSLVEITKKNKDHGLQIFYPDRVEYQEKKAQHATFNRMAQSRPDWAAAIYKLALASSLREHFDTSGAYAHTSFARLDACAPLLTVMPPDFREALFIELTQSVAAVARLRDKSFKAADPWGSYADGLYNAWAIDHHDDEVEAQTALGLFTAWLDQWQHPFQEDMRMMAMIAGDASSMGNWLSQTVAQKEAEKEWQKESQNDPQILLHELLDSPLEERVKTDPQKEPQKEWQNDPQGTTSAAAAPPPASPQEKIPPKQDFAVTHPNDYWNVGGLF